ncbi:MAG TPA: extracellular matrix/biofilm biosynthesis regulator RemA family protein [Patescibacteria group bacterium]|nr:extracellular matrix/biofilm biosynthesis regulator RemA family protein [Patescibacteria group bacterium]
MFIHLGGDVVISLKDVISIMDVESSNLSNTTKEFLSIAEDEGFIQKISEDEPKSFILTEKKNKTIIYLSPISSVTLFKRAGFIDNISLK